ncbi:IucA/IucC family protein [Acinetobacter pittii]|uniref:IucA/IucC family protein n=1 Tax=Acinetobacter pittii TaxID=48296 RepID=UPI0030186C12
MGNLHPALSTTTHSVNTSTLAWQQPDQSTMKKVEQRVIKQLLQALIYEEVIPAQFKDGVFYIDVINSQGQSVRYVAAGQRHLSFGLVRMNATDVIREDHQGKKTVAQLNLVIDEVIRSIPKAAQIDGFISELKRTFIHDVQSQHCQNEYALPAAQYSYDVLETYLMDGHPYHPCYKSRVGFNLQDNLKYGVEYAQPIHLVWIAVHQSIFSHNASSHLNADDFLQQQLTEQDQQEFTKVLGQQKNADEYIWLPVHPWQWENTIVHVLFKEIAEQKIVYLGRGEYAYIAQQSLRTLTNLQHPEKPYIKLSMSLTNTSSSRILATHTAMNGPLITDWLQSLKKNSEIAQKLDFDILGEVHASAVDFTRLPESHAKQAYGTIASLWRESVQQYLKSGEDAIPLNGIGHVQKDGKLLIAPWLDQYGVDAWVGQLLSVVIQPILYLLFAEGIGTESHGQNIILVHRNGWPVRIILKDFHDGVRFSPDHLTHPEAFPVLHALPAEHAKANRMSFILTDDLNAVRDFSCACLFFVALSDIAITLKQHLDFSEQVFWQKAADIIHHFQQQYPQHQSRYAVFDVFAEQYCIESLTRRRLFGDGDVQMRYVNNPLFHFRQPV